MIPTTPASGACERRCGIGAGVIIVILALVVAASFAFGQGNTGTANERATEGFRAMHQSLRTHINHMIAMAGQLPKQPAEEQKTTMDEIVTCLTDNIHSHARVEEEVLYPVVDQAAGTTGEFLFTATMRYEHRIVGRWITELRNNANQPTPDVTAFARRTDNLLGLVTAHFEEEEDILLPVLDAKMTVAQFKKEVLDKMEE